MSLVLVFALLLAIPSSLLAADARPQRQVDLFQVPGTAQAGWEKTVAAAKKEGQVVIYSGPGTTLYSIDTGVFQKKFPEIKVVAAGGDTVQRVLSERRAGKYLADVAMSGFTPILLLNSAKALDSIRDAMILPEILDESKWWGGKHYYLDPERKHVFSYIGKPSSGEIAYNPNLVNPHEFQSLRDFLNPKWKGKISMRDPRTIGPGSSTLMMFYYHPKLGPEYIRRLLGETDITIFRDPRQGVDWLVSGKYPITFFSYPSQVARAQRQGLPIVDFDRTKEGMYLSSHAGVIGFVNRAPHPNAAKVFINWLLSREGQMVVQTEYVKSATAGPQSLRIDIPKDMISPPHHLPKYI